MVLMLCLVGIKLLHLIGVNDMAIYSYFSFILYFRILATGIWNAIITSNSQ